MKVDERVHVVVQIRGGVAEIVSLAPGLRAEIVDYDNDSSTLYCGRMDINSTASHTTTYRQINNQPDSWECTKCVHALVDGMNPSEYNASYCPGCGRRITGEEPWRDDEGSGLHDANS